MHNIKDFCRWAFPWILMMCFAALPLYYSLQSLTVILLAVCWFSAGYWQGARKNIRAHSFLLLPIAYAALLGISVFYSGNIDAGLQELGRKSALFILPLLMMTAPTLLPFEVRRLSAGYCAGLLLALLICYARAAARYPVSGSNGFLYDELAGGVDSNAVFLSWKTMLGFILLLRTPTVPGMQKWRWPAVLLLFIFILMLASKTLMLIAAAVLVMQGWQFWRGRDKVPMKRSAVWLTALLIMLAIGIGSWFSRPIFKRYTDVFTIKNSWHSNQSTELSTADNFSKRLTLWKAGITAVNKNGLWLQGRGLGGTEQMINAQLADTGFHFRSFRNIASLQNMNLHNTYLQTLITTGLAGLLLLLAMVFTALHRAWKVRDKSVVLWLIITLVFMAQEAVFQVQAGLMCFAVVISALANSRQWSIFKQKRLN